MKPSFIGIDELDLSQKLSSTSDNPDFYSKYQIVARIVDGSNEHSVWRHTRDYLTCFISIRDCIIKSCFAKGWGQSGDGGAVSALNSQLKIENNIFEKNEANSGGSIAAYNSNVLITRTLFSKDIGYVSAGSLVVTGNLKYVPVSTTIYHSEVPSTTDPYFCQIYDSAFEGSSSFEFYGAAFFNSIPEVFFRNVTFSGCHTGTSGGALGFVDSSAYLYECILKNNYCGKKSSPVWGTENGESKVHFSSLVKGGGAIFFTAQNQPEDYWNYPSLLELVTQECKFTCNYVDDRVHPLSPQKNPGFDILFYKYSMYRSYWDQFTWPNETSIAIYPDEILRITQYNSKVTTSCEKPSQEYFTVTDVDYSTDTLSLYTDPEVIKPATTKAITLPSTPLPPVTTRSRFAHTRPSVLTETLSRKIQSPTPSHSQSPTCSTYGQTVLHPVKYRTNIQTITPSYYWEVDPTKTQTTLPDGQTWPAQTTCLSPTKSLPGHLPDANRPTQSWWGEYPNSRATPSFSFYGELSQSPAPEAFPTYLGTAWPGQSYKTLTITNSKTLTVTFYTTKMYSYSEKPIEVESYVKGEGEHGTYYTTRSLTERVLIDGLMTKETVITRLFISIEYSRLPSTQSLAENEEFVENPSITETVIMVQKQTQTILVSTEESFVESMTLSVVCDGEDCDENNLTLVATKVASMIEHTTVASVYVFSASATLQNVIQLSRKQKRTARDPIDTGIILGIAIAICALIFGVTVGILFMRRRSKREQAKLAEEMGDQFDFSGASDEDIIDDNDGVTATIDVPSEDLNQTFDEADNWI